MIELKGKHNSCKIFTDNIDKESMSQIYDMLNNEHFKDETIRFMPDVHAGKGCVIGTVMTYSNKLVPNWIGVDINCGVQVIKLKNVTDIDFEKLDETIHRNILAGSSVRRREHEYIKKVDLSSLNYPVRNMDRIRRSMGTLGGGNHFIELNKGSNNDYYLAIHSGSRNLGYQVANYYQKEAYKQCTGEIATKRKKTSKKGGIKANVKSDLQKLSGSITRDSAFLTGKLMDDYINDIKIVSDFADWNRKAISHDILRLMDWEADYEFTTNHNYIDIQNKIIRKGAVAANKGELLIIPINMRDGSLLCKGLGNPDWLYSAPHGAGRVMSRTEAKRKLVLSDFRNEMKDVFSTSVVSSTIDEAPMAYKPISDIIESIDNQAVEIVDRLIPVYNFKAKN